MFLTAVLNLASRLEKGISGNIINEIIILLIFHGCTMCDFKYGHIPIMLSQSHTTFIHVFCKIVVACDQLLLVVL